MKKPIVFVDNANIHWNGDMDVYKQFVHYIEVPNSTRDAEPKYTNHLAKSGNQYAINLLKSDSRNFVNKGIDQKIANRLKKWSSIPSQNQKYALFDWDGTISATEGFSLDLQPIKFTSYMMDFLLPSYRGGTNRRSRRHHRRPQTTRKYFAVKKTREDKDEDEDEDKENTLQEMVKSEKYKETLTYPLVIPPKEFLDDMFVYMMRPERVEMLRDLFDTLSSNGVKIHIFTHNPYASTANPYRQIFIEMLLRLLNQREDVNQMLHSTIDYTKPGEPYLKRNMFAGINAISRGKI